MTRNIQLDAALPRAALAHLKAPEAWGAFWFYPPTANLCIAAATTVLAKKKDGPPNSIMYFEQAIRPVAASLKSNVA